MKTEIFVAGLLLASLVATLWATENQSAKKNGTSEPGIPVSLASYIPDTQRDGDVLIGLENLDKRLTTQWRESRAKGRKFSRGSSADVRPRRDLYNPSTRFSPIQTVPERVFMGTFVLERNQTALNFPILYNRYDDQTLLFAHGKWHDFEEWLVSKPGVHL